MANRQKWRSNLLNYYACNGEVIGVARGPCSPKLFGYLVILCFEKRRPKRKYYCSLS